MDSSKNCIAVENYSTKVPNCRIFADAENCKECAANYFLTAPKTCEAWSSTISNCLEAESKDSCKVCSSGYQRTLTNSKYTCKLITILNCDIVEPEKEICISCKQNYYVDTQGKCALGTTIANCLELSDATKCKRCQTNFALSLDTTKCVSRSGIDPNCTDTKMISEFACSICKAGYDFSNGVCQKNTKATIESGCFEEDTDGKCLFCISGFSMGTNGSCTNNNPDAPVPESVGIFGAFLGLMFMLLF